MAINILSNHVRNVIVESVVEATQELLPSLTGEQLARNVGAQLRSLSLEDAIGIYVEALSQ